MARNGLTAAAAETAGAAALSVTRRDGLTRAPIACGGPKSLLEKGDPAAEATIPGCPDPLTVALGPLPSA